MAETGVEHQEIFCAERLERTIRTSGRASHDLKALTRRVPASEWTPEYRELANPIHTFGREAFFVNPEDFRTGCPSEESLADRREGRVIARNIPHGLVSGP
jgi:hypothetical protein